MRGKTGKLRLSASNVIPSRKEVEARNLILWEEFSVENEIPRRAAPRNDKAAEVRPVVNHRAHS
jgi:hypothetical protein